MRWGCASVGQYMGLVPLLMRGSAVRLMLIDATVVQTAGRAISTSPEFT